MGADVPIDLHAHARVDGGLGNADFTTRRLVDKMNTHISYMNAITSSCPEAVRIPPYFDSDREAIETALNTVGDIPPQKAKIVRILNTLKLEEMMISEAVLPDAGPMDNLSTIGSPAAMEFDAQGNLI